MLKSWSTLGEISSGPEYSSGWRVDNISIGEVTISLRIGGTLECCNITQLSETWLNTLRSSFVNITNVVHSLQKTESLAHTEDKLSLYNGINYISSAP